MGWLWLLALAGLALAVMWRAGLPRDLWAFVGAALMLGAAGYALQGAPGLPGSPTVEAARSIPIDPGLSELRGKMLGRFTGVAAYQTAADAMLSRGNTEAAVAAMLGGIRLAPNSVALWTGLGDTIALHDEGIVSPASRFAFTRAARLNPKHPAPPFFLGLALARNGQFVEARPFWVLALGLTPPDASYREEIALRLVLLDQFIAQQAQTAEEQAGAPVGE